jgi:zinc protease
LAADIVLKPEFPEREVERVRNDRITHIQQQKDVPNSLAIKAFFKALYGPGHPYGYTEIGTEESVAAISREALVRFWEEGYSPQHSALVVAGDLTERELLRLAETYFGGWTGTVKQVLPPEKVQGGGRRIILIDKPGIPQSVLRIGHMGVERAHPDYVPIDVMNTTLGGLFSSRINLNLRERHGFTYGASSSFLFRRGPGPFVVATGVRADATAQAITEIFGEIGRMRDTEPTQAEMTLAKDSISRSLPGLFETTSDTVSSIGQLFAHNLSSDYYHTLPDRIETVTASDVRQAAAAHLNPEEMVIVVVGDRNTVGPQLESLGFPLEVQ